MRRFVLAVFVVMLAIEPVARAQSTIVPSSVRVVNSPNALTWPVTTAITRVDVTNDGVTLTFDRCTSWPPVTPPGWAGPLIFTVWLFENIGGQWYASGIVQAWSCDRGWGGAIWQDQQIARNWVYDERWSAMVRHQPAPGERIGFMVSAGNARGQDDHIVMERSTIVEVAMPTGPGTVPILANEGQPPIVSPPIIPTPTPIPVPPIPPVPPVTTPPDPTLVVLLQHQIADLQGQLVSEQAALSAQIKAAEDAVNARIDAFEGRVQNAWKQYGLPIVTALGALVAGHFTAK